MQSVRLYDSLIASMSDEAQATLQALARCSLHPVQLGDALASQQASKRGGDEESELTDCDTVYRGPPSTLRHHRCLP